MDALAQLVGQSTGLAAVRDQVRRLLDRQSESRRMPPILIQGETGSGKGLIARAMHGASGRANGPFVDVNCAAIPETLLEAEMFGVERGAFTDARQAKPGLFQLAHRGTIFLDEIGLLPEGLQAKLLKAIEERAVRRLGGTRTEPVDVWVVAATNEDLIAATRDRRFRADLYHRLAVVTVSLPPLRERGDDVVLLAEHFLARACADYGMAPKVITPEARAALRAYAWPGNVRELSNVMERVALLGEGAAVTSAMLALPAPAAVEAPREPAADARTLDAAVDDVEREHLLAALRETDWNVTRAAMRLGISRNTLRYRIEKHGLRPGVAPPRRRVGAAADRAAAPPPTAVGPTPVVPISVAPAPAAPVAVGQRERRRLALMRAEWGVRPGADAPFVSRRALELLSDKARAFGGRVEELSASGIVAAFGVEPVEDAPVRAANAARAIVNGIDRARRAEGLNVGVKAAIHVDHFVVAPASAGPAIDTEARPRVWALLDHLLDSAEPDGIVASEAAMRSLERCFDVVTAPAPARGGEPVFRLAGRERLALGLPGRTAAFVGRYHELELLRSRFESAVRGHGQVIGIAGDAGIGKSRLLYEFRRSLAGQPVDYLEGRCHSYTATIPYTPVLDVVRAACSLSEADAPDTTAVKVAAALRDVGMDASVAAPYVLYLLGIKEGAEALASRTPEAIKPRVLETLRQFMVRMSHRRPLIVIVEDLQSIDAPSEEYFASLAEVVVATPLLLVSTYRPGYRPPWIDRSYATQMALQPLSFDASRAVVQAVLGEAASVTLIEELVVKAEGNPFFLEELARVVREHDSGGAAVIIPDTVKDVLLTRIARLVPGDRRVLDAAAVIGKQVPLPVLRALAGEPDEALAQSLMRLRSAEFLYESTVGSEPEYTFKHALTQEVAYDSVDPDWRRALHDTIVNVLEALYPGRLREQAERLAHHALQAGRWAKAALYAREAGDKALARSAHREAAAWFQHALEALEQLPPSDRTADQAIEIRFGLRNALHLRGEFGRIVRYLDEAKVLTEARNDQHRLGQVLTYEAQYFRLLGELDRAVEAGERAVAIADRLGDFPLRVAAVNHLGPAYTAQGRYDEAIEALQANVEAIRGSVLTDALGLAGLPSVFSRIYLASALAERGRFDEAIVHADEAIRLADTAAHVYSLVFADAGAGTVHLLRGDVGPACTLLERGFARCEEYSFIVMSPVLASALGAVYALLGRHAEGIPLLQRAVEQTTRTGGRSVLVARLGEALLQAGRVEEARRHADEAVAHARAHGERGHEGYALRLQGEVLARVGDVTAAETGYRAALSVAETLAMRPLMAHGHRGLAALYRRLGRAADAERHAAIATAMFAEMRMTFWLEHEAPE